MSFDLLAAHYGWMETVMAGGVMQRARVAHLDRLKGRQKILILGEGPGRFLAAALPALPEARFTCVDASAAMIAAARRRLGPAASSDRIRWIHAELPGWLPAPEAGFDAVVTDCFLDCFPPDQLRVVIDGVAEACAPDATWLIADFGIPEDGWRRWRAQAIHALMYAFFRVVTCLPARRWTDPADYLSAVGFRCAARRDFEHGLVQSHCWERSAVYSGLIETLPTMEMST